MRAEESKKPDKRRYKTTYWREYNKVASKLVKLDVPEAEAHATALKEWHGKNR